MAENTRTKQLIKDEITPKVLDKIGISSDQVKDVIIKQVSESNTFMMNVPFIVTIKYHKDQKNPGENTFSEFTFLTKITFEAAVARKLCELNQRYEREVLTFDKYISRLSPRGKSIFPEFFSGSYNSGSNDFIALEFLNQYQMSKKVNQTYPWMMDEDHMTLALSSLGIFHGSSYAMKEKHPDEYQKLSEIFPGSRYQEDNFKDSMKESYEVLTLRAFEDFRRATNYDPRIYDKLEKLFRDIGPMMRDLVAPKEPLAIVAHGDFNRNNILFKYDSIGKPVASKIIDLQFSMYTTPAVDLSFLIYMNTTHEQREKNFDKYFSIYHHAVIQTLDEEEVLNDVNRIKYSRQAFYDDFQRHILISFPVIAFYLPSSTDKERPEMEDLFTNESLHFGSRLKKRLQDDCDRLYPCEEVTMILKHMVDTFLL